MSKKEFKPQYILIQGTHIKVPEAEMEGISVQEWICRKLLLDYDKTEVDLRDCFLEKSE